MDRRTFIGALLVPGLVSCSSSPPPVPAPEATQGALSTATRPASLETSVAPSTTSLARATSVKVFFGHQSVGRNIIKGINAALKGDTRLRVVELTTERSEPPRGEGGYFAHANIGKNEEPYTKIRAFDTLLRDGLGAHVEVALLKLCYVDVTSGTDVQALFETYRDTLASLAQDYPDVRFLHATVPLTTSQVENNILREKYSDLLRSQYRGALFDIAALESTAPDGSRVGGRDRSGRSYFELHGAYTSDGGHLNSEAARMAAVALLALIGESGRD